MSISLQMASLFIAALALTMPGIVMLSIRLGRLEERQERQRIDHDELYLYAHNLSHDSLTRVIEKLNSLQIQILKITPRERWDEIMKHDAKPE